MNRQSPPADDDHGKLTGGGTTRHMTHKTYLIVRKWRSITSCIELAAIPIAGCYMKVLLSAYASLPHDARIISDIAVMTAVNAFLEVERHALLGSLVWDPLTPSAQILLALVNSGVPVVEFEAKRPASGAMEQAFKGSKRLLAPSIVTMPRPEMFTVLLDHAINGLSAEYFAALLPGDHWSQESNYRTYLRIPPAYIYPLVVTEACKSTLADVRVLTNFIWCVWLRGSKGPSCFRPLIVGDNVDGRDRSTRNRAEPNLLLATSTARARLH